MLRFGIWPGRVTLKSNEQEAGGKGRRKSAERLPVFDDEITEKKVKLFTGNKDQKQVSKARREMVS